MKKIIFASLFSVVSLSVFALGELPEGKCPCPTCPSGVRDCKNTGVQFPRQSNNNKVSDTSSDKKGVRAHSSKTGQQ